MGIGSLCTGYGGLDMAAESVLGGRCSWVCDPDPGAAALLARRYPDVPNLGDLTAVDWTSVAPIDVLLAGFPCQDVSSAGRQAGLRAGNRTGLWLHIVEVIRVLRPRLVIFENVRGLLSAEADSAMEPCPWCVGDGPATGLRALGAVLGDLADLGFDAEWCLLPASGVGAPHRRERVFIVAAPAADAEGDGWPPERVAERTGPARPGARRGGPPAADAEGDGRGEGRPESARFVGGSDAAQRGDAAPDTDSGPVREQPVAVAGCGSPPGAGPDRQATPDPDGDGRDGGPVGPGLETPLGTDADGRVLDWAGYAPAIQRWERTLGRRAPAPTVLGKRGGRQLSPRFVEWMQGLPEGWVCDIPGLTRNQQLKLLGNGVVPRQAETALRHLLPLLLDRSAVAA